MPCPFHKLMTSTSSSPSPSPSHTRYGMHPTTMRLPVLALHRYCSRPCLTTRTAILRILSWLTCLVSATPIPVHA